MATKNRLGLIVSLTTALLSMTVTAMAQEEHGFKNINVIEDFTDNAVASRA